MARKDLQSTFKTCCGCGRNLSGVWFLFTQVDDGLTSDCRTCRSHRKGYPGVDEAVDHEKEMRSIFTTAIIELMEIYPHRSEDQILRFHRGQFEQICQRIMDKAGLSKDWKMPIWVSKTSLD